MKAVRKGRHSILRQKRKGRMVFNQESEFEEALIKVLSEKGWEKK